MKFDFKQKMEEPETLQLYLYSEVVPDERNRLTGEEVKSKTSAEYFREQLSKYPGVETIELHINSEGGSVREGYGIYSQLRNHPAQKIVYIDAFAHSIASIIAMAGDKIIMRINAMMGIHNAGAYLGGPAKAHRKIADDLDRIMEGNRQIYLQRSGGKISEEKLIKLLDEGAMLTAKECLEYGFCDEIVDLPVDQNQVLQMMCQVNAGIASQIKYHQDLVQAFNGAMKYEPMQNEKPEEEDEAPVQSMKSFFKKLSQAGK